MEFKERSARNFCCSAPSTQIMAAREQQTSIISLSPPYGKTTLLKTAISLRPNNVTNNGNEGINERVIGRQLSTNHQFDSIKIVKPIKIPDGIRSPKLFLNTVEIPLEKNPSSILFDDKKATSTPSLRPSLNVANKTGKNVSKVHVPPTKQIDAAARNEYEEGQREADDNYRVILLDSKPFPGRLENFIPEVERSAIIESETTKCFDKRIKDEEIEQPRIVRNYRQYLMPPGVQQHNRMVKNSMSAIASWIQNNDNKTDGEDENETEQQSTPLIRDQNGKLIVESSVWRRFLAEQRPQTSVPLISPIQIVHYKENNFWQWHKPKIFVKDEVALNEKI